MPPVQDALRNFQDTEFLTILDEALLALVIEKGRVTPECKERLITQLGLAADAHSDAVLVTCNVYSLAVREARDRLAPLKILAVDEPMAARAVRAGSRIGVVGTGHSGLRAQADLLADTARRAGRDVDIRPVLCADAFTALKAGDAARHDELVFDAIASLADTDAIVLAQASMARLVGRLPTVGPPVLASPALAAAELAAMLNGHPAGLSRTSRRASTTRGTMQ